LRSANTIIQIAFLKKRPLPDLLEIPPRWPGVRFNFQRAAGEIVGMAEFFDHTPFQEIPAIQSKQVKSIVVGQSLSEQEQVEHAPAILSKAAEFSIKNRILHFQTAGNCSEKLIKSAEGMPISAHQFAGAVLDISLTAESIDLQLLCGALHYVALERRASHETSTQPPVTPHNFIRILGSPECRFETLGEHCRTVPVQKRRVSAAVSA
jgi:hypothetical protein